MALTLLIAIGVMVLLASRGRRRRSRLRSRKQLLISPRTAEERLGPATREAIEARLRRGDRLGAMQLYREVTGAPAVDAAAAIDTWRFSEAKGLREEDTSEPTDIAQHPDDGGRDDGEWPQLPPENRSPR